MGFFMSIGLEIMPKFGLEVIFDKLSGNSGGAVRLGMFFMSNGGGFMTKFCLGVDLWWMWGFENILAITNNFEKNYLISLR